MKNQEDEFEYCRDLNWFQRKLREKDAEIDSLKYELKRLRQEASANRRAQPKEVSMKKFWLVTVIVLLLTAPVWAQSGHFVDGGNNAPQCVDGGTRLT